MATVFHAADGGAIAQGGSEGEAAEPQDRERLSCWAGDEGRGGTCGVHGDVAASVRALGQVLSDSHMPTGMPSNLCMRVRTVEAQYAFAHVCACTVFVLV